MRSIDYVAVALGIGGLICIYILSWLETILIKRRARDYERNLPTMLKTPDFVSLEKSLGKRIPDEIRAFYSDNSELLFRRRFRLTDNNQVFEIDHFLPAVPSVILPLTHGDAVYPFATDGKVGFYEVYIDADNSAQYLKVRYSRDTVIELGMSFSQFVNLKAA